MARARHATRSDVAALGRTLAAAFATDPLWRWLVPDERRWRRGADAAFAAEASIRLRAGHTYTTDDAAGAALWAPPGLWRETWLDAARSAPAFGRLLGASRARLGVALLKAIEHAHPEGDHWYLAVLGTGPEHQGRGVASALLAPVLARCDLDGTGAYLESSNPANVAFYERHGFAVVGRAGAPGGPPMDLMWRDPRPPTDPAVGGGGR